MTMAYYWQANTTTNYHQRHEHNTFVSSESPIHHHHQQQQQQQQQQERRHLSQRQPDLHLQQQMQQQQQLTIAAINWHLAPGEEDPSGHLDQMVSANQDSSASQAFSDEMFEFKTEEMNFSELQKLWYRKDSLDILIRVSFVAPIVLLGIVGNLIIIYSMCKSKQFRSKPTNIFILNMAIADLLTIMVCPTAALFTDIYQFYVLGSFICRFEGFVKITCLLVSSYSLIVLSLDWLLCVVQPCRTRFSIKQSWIALTTIWIASILMASPLFVWRKLRQRQWHDLMEIWCCEMIQYTKYYWVVITLFLIYLPTFIMTIVLVVILAKMDKFEAKLKRSCAGNGKNNSSLTINMKYRRRIVKILFTYLLTSIICWTPLQFTIIYRHFRTEPIPSPWFFELAFFSQLSASLTGAMNPIIFGFLSQPFRRMVARSFMFKFLDKIVTTNNATHQNNNNNNNNNNNENHNPNRANEINLNQVQAIDRPALPVDINHNYNHHKHHHNHHHHNHINHNKQITAAAAATSKRTPTGPTQLHNQHQFISHNPSIRVEPSTAQAAASTRFKSSREAVNLSSLDDQPVVALIGSCYLDRNKRVSFNTSPTIPGRSNSNQITIGYDNACYDNESSQVEHMSISSKVARGNGTLYNGKNRVLNETNTTTTTTTTSQIKQPELDMTTSFIGQVVQMRPLSFVSMDSINIEESLADDLMISDDDNEFKKGNKKGRTTTTTTTTTTMMAANNVRSINGESCEH